MTERRARQRFPLRLRLVVRNLNHIEAEPQAGETLNVSSTGVYLLAGKQSFAAGGRVELSMWLPVGGPTGSTCLQGLGRVVRLDPQAGEKVGIAIALERIEWLRLDATGLAT